MTQLEKEIKWQHLIQKGMITTFFSEYNHISEKTQIYNWICKHLDKDIFDSEFNFYYRFIAYSTSKVEFESKLHLID
jgi:hypothetical protein